MWSTEACLHSNPTRWMDMSSRTPSKSAPASPGPSLPKPTNDSTCGQWTGDGGTLFLFEWGRAHGWLNEAYDLETLGVCQLTSGHLSHKGSEPMERLDTMPERLNSHTLDLKSFFNQLLLFNMSYVVSLSLSNFSSKLVWFLDSVKCWVEGFFTSWKLNFLKIWKSLPREHDPSKVPPKVPMHFCPQRLFHPMILEGFRKIQNSLNISTLAASQLS